MNVITYLGYGWQLTEETEEGKHKYYIRHQDRSGTGGRVYLNEEGYRTAKKTGYSSAKRARKVYRRLEEKKRGTLDFPNAEDEKKRDREGGVYHAPGVSEKEDSQNDGGNADQTEEGKTVEKLPDSGGLKWITHPDGTVYIVKDVDGKRKYVQKNGTLSTEKKGYSEVTALDVLKRYDEKVGIDSSGKSESSEDSGATQSDSGSSRRQVVVRASNPSPNLSGSVRPASVQAESGGDTSIFEGIPSPILLGLGILLAITILSGDENG